MSDPDFDLADENADITSHDTFVKGVPHGTFRRLRDEDPVSWWDERDGAGFWAVTRYDDVLEVSLDPGTFTTTSGIRLEEMDPEETAARRTLMELDPPDHTPLRRLVSKGFTPRMVASYEDAIRALAVEVVEEALQQDRFDFVTEIARRLPMRMLGRMLDLPDADGDRLVEWGDAMLGNTDPEFTAHVVDLVDTDEYRLLPFRSPAAVEVFDYAAEVATERRSCPGHDVVSQLLAETTQGTTLSDAEFKNFFTLLVAAGNDTTRYSMAHGMWMLLRHPEVAARWREDRSISERAVDEILRTGSVTMHFRRTATADTELGGRSVRAGDKVVMWFIAADFDDRHFADPYVFDVDREVLDHHAFGARGPHLCLGAWLARTELKVLFEELLPRLADVRLDGEVERLRSNFIAGIKHLPIEISRA